MQSNTINQIHMVKNIPAQDYGKDTIERLIVTTQQEPDNSAATRELADIIIEHI